MMGFANAPVMGLTPPISGLPSATTLEKVRVMLADKQVQLRNDALRKQAEWAAELAMLRDPPRTMVAADTYVRWDLRVAAISSRLATAESTAAIDKFVANTPRDTAAGDGTDAEERKEKGALRAIAEALGFKR